MCIGVARYKHSLLSQKFECISWVSEFDFSQKSMKNISDYELFIHNFIEDKFIKSNIGLFMGDSIKIKRNIVGEL